MKRKPKPPTWLDTTAKKYWQVLSPLVDLNNESIKEQLAMLCDNWSVFREVTATLHKDGLSFINDFGKITTHPLLPTKWKAQFEIQKLSKSLGVSNDVSIDDADELDEFI